MRNGLLLIFLLFAFFPVKSQVDDEDYTWWNELHDWNPGDPGWRNWIKMAPGYMGPNALPVPEVKKGVLSGSLNVEMTASSHYLPGDPTRDLAGLVYIPFARQTVAVEMYGVFLERYAFSEKIRNERISRDRDGKGIAVGDFYFSTLIQVSKNRKFPNTLFRFAVKTASGSPLKAVRYTDTPGYFFDLSFSEILGHEQTGMFRPFWGLGFYSWHTNDENNLQNDAFMYAGGTDWIKKQWLLSASLAGYYGYKNRRDRPAQLNFEIRNDFGHNALRLQYSYGLPVWQHNTLRLSYIRKFKAPG